MFCLGFLKIKKAYGGRIVAVVIAAAVTCVVISVNKRGTKQTLAVEETTTQAETVTQEQTTEEQKSLKISCLKQMRMRVQ